MSLATLEGSQRHQDLAQEVFCWAALELPRPFMIDSSWAHLARTFHFCYGHLLGGGHHGKVQEKQFFKVETDTTKSTAADFLPASHLAAEATNLFSKGFSAVHLGLI